MNDLQIKVNNTNHDINGKLRKLAVVREGQQATKALRYNESLAENLMEKVCAASNLNRAYKRVKANKGSAGSDGMTVDQLSQWIMAHKEKKTSKLIA